MKRNKLFTFLCVALGTATLFAGCGGDNSSMKTGNFTDDDFIKMSYVMDAKYYTDSYIDEEGHRTGYEANINGTYGEYVGYTQGAILFRKTDKDFMNNVVDTYTLYNIYEDKAVWTHVSKYQDIDLDAVDEYGNRKYPEKTEEVSINQFGVTVTTTTYTRLDDEVIEEKELDFSYTSKAHYAFYDVNGKMVAESELDGTVEILYSKYATFGGITCKVLFGGTTIGVYEENDDGIKLVKTYKASTQEAIYLYDYTTDKYGYMLEDGVQIYDRATGALKYSYDIATGGLGNMGGSGASVLANGDVIVQYYEMSQDPNADIVIPMYGIGMNVATEIISVATGARRQIEMDYIFQQVVNKAVVSTSGSGENVSVQLGSCFVNCGLGFKTSDYAEVAMGNGSMQDLALAVFFDNNGKVQYTMPATTMMGMSDYQLLPDGSYLAEVKTPLTDVNGGEVTQVIYNADGTVRSYLPAKAVVANDFVLIPGVGIYDFDLKQICAWDKIKGDNTANDETWRFVDVIGDNVILTGYNGNNAYYQLGRYAKNGFALRYLGNDITDMEFYGDYVVVRRQVNSNDGAKEYLDLYNVEMELLLSNIGYGYRAIATEKALVVITEDGNVYCFNAKTYPTNYVYEYSNSFRDTNENGIPDQLEEELRDWNGNGIPDCYEYYGGADSNGDGIPDDYDENDNGVDDRIEEWI